MTEETIRILIQEAIFEYGVVYTTIAVLVILSLFGFIYYHLKKKFHHNIECLKTNNDKVNYISKTQFDIEFQIYQELYKQIFSLAHEMIYSATEYKCYDKLHKKFKILLNCIKMKAPFINKDMYESFNIFIKAIQDTLSIRLKLEWEEEISKLKKVKKITKEELTLEKNYLNETVSLNQNLEILTDKLRDYLNSLRVY